MGSAARTRTTALASAASTTGSRRSAGGSSSRAQKGRARACSPRFRSQASEQAPERDCAPRYHARQLTLRPPSGQYRNLFFEGKGRMMTKLLWRATAVLTVIGALAAVPLLLSHDSHSQSAAAKAVTARLAHAAVLERERGEEAGGGADAQAYTDRAYPGDEVSMDEIQGALAANDAATARGAKLGSKWDFIGPDTLDVDRLGTQSFIKPTQWSGRVTALAVDPKCKPQECTLYLGAAGGGLWRTKNALAQNPSWKQISDGIPTNAIGSIAVDPNDPTGKTIYVGTGEANASGDSEAGLGLYKTTDDGAHWSLVPGSFAVANNRAITWVAIEKGNPNHIVLGTRSGVHGIGSNATNVATVPAQSPVVGLYNSTDGGASFTLSVAGSFNEVKFDPRDPNTVYAAQATVGLIRSTTGGVAGSW